MNLAVYQAPSEPVLIVSIIAPRMNTAVEPIIVYLRPYLLVRGYIIKHATKDPSCSSPTVREFTFETFPEVYL
jgi:hypothetical protein